MHCMEALQYVTTCTHVFKLAKIPSKFLQQGRRRIHMKILFNKVIGKK